MGEGWRPSTGQKIEALYAWVAIEPDGGEGVVAITLPGLGPTPLIGADGARIESMREAAMHVRKTMKLPVLLKKFSAVETLEVHQP